MNPRILVVADNSDAGKLIEAELREAGYKVLTASNGSVALRKARSAGPHLIVLDLTRPETGGLDLCKSLRFDPDTAHVPIILVTSQAAEIDRILGLELGADDYLTEPFRPRELVLRIEKLLHWHAAIFAPRDQYRVGSLAVDVPGHSVTVEDRPVRLTATEFRLPTWLICQQGRVLTRNQLLQQVWGYDRPVETRTVDTHVRRLRRKLGAAAGCVVTVYGVGYRFSEG